MAGQLSGVAAAEDRREDRVGGVLDLSADGRVEVGGDGAADRGDADDVLEDLEKIERNIKTSAKEKLFEFDFSFHSFLSYHVPADDKRPQLAQSNVRILKKAKKEKVSTF